MIEDLFVRALGGGETIDGHRQVAGLITDVWLANLAAFVTRRASATQTRDHIDRAVRLLLCVVPAPNSHLRYC
ncbi:TetR family transcriptional regulator [Mycolicibacterium conceptionense]|uniref:TetR family transcriptional regulator n=1 Tax=Mycolicibacterium conceptionense TaxID=451644 RepID=A0A0U1D1L5_9MYCO|nr:TetR family transcriptional regulator [Mycolicibacterium conceptionense]